MKNFIPLCFYPTRKIILDDDSLFSDSILFKMENKFFSSSNSPHSLLNYFLHEYKPELQQADVLSASPIDSVDYNINIPRKKLESIFTSKNPNDISVLLIDYHMPGMTGIEFVSQVKDYSFKKILVTGEQDYYIGIDALNAGLIDAYVRKDDPNLISKLDALVAALEWKYFSDFCLPIYSNSDLGYLSSDAFISKFKHFISENKITTFFLENAEGDFLSFGLNGKSYIAVRTKKQLQELSHLAAEDGASNEVINWLANAEVIPFFGNKQYWEIPAKKWNEYLYPAQMIEGDSELVWAVISKEFLKMSSF